MNKEKDLNKIKATVLTLWFCGCVNQGIDLVKKYGLNFDELIAEYEKKIF